MKRKSFVAALLLGLLVFSGCYRTLYRGPNLSFPAGMQNPEQGEVVVDHFTVRVWNHYFVSGMFPTSVPDINAIVKSHVPEGHAVRRLTIRHEYSFVNGLISGLTDGVYSPWTTTISGDVVRPSGSGAVPPVKEAI